MTNTATLTQAPTVDSIIAAIETDLDAAADAAALISAPLFAYARTWEELRTSTTFQRLPALIDQRPDLAAAVASHYGTIAQVGTLYQRLMDEALSRLDAHLHERHGWPDAPTPGTPLYTGALAEAKHYVRPLP